MKKIEKIIQNAAATAGGNTKNHTSEKEKCPFNQCDGSGWCMDSENRVYRCKCQVVREKQARAERLFVAAKIPKRFRNKNLEDFDTKLQQDAWKIATRYVEKFDELREKDKNGLCFIGPTGTGKSHLAYGILNSLLAKGVPGLCGSVPEIMDQLRNYSEGETTERLELLKTLDVVILDDLGAERNSPWVTERLYVIINSRYNEVLPTIITSNHELEELQELPGWERITSRIFEMCHLVVVDGPDYRKGGES